MSSRSVYMSRVFVWLMPVLLLLGCNLNTKGFMQQEEVTDVKRSGITAIDAQTEFRILSPVDGGLVRGNFSVSWQGGRPDLPTSVRLTDSGACLSSASGVTIEKAAAIEEKSVDFEGVSEGNWILCAVQTIGDLAVMAENAPMEVTVDSTAPGSFAITAPLGPYKGSSATTTSLPVAWMASDGAGYYRVTLGSDASCATVITSLETTETTVTLTQLSLDDQSHYYVCVEAVDEAGNGVVASNNSSSFLIDWQSPSIPGGLAVNLSSLQLTVSWRASADRGLARTAGYELRVRNTTDNTSSTSKIDAPGVNKVLTVLSGKNYSIDIRSYDHAENYSEWSTAVSQVVP